MNTSALTDLDDLLSSIRERESRRLIEEAVAAYRGGSLRPAIVATWIAVVADLFAKIREIAAAGDKAAARYIEDLDNAVSKNYLSKLQEIERDLLGKASDEFNFLSPHELRDLERLQQDRHLCAHPALVTKEVIFQPTPELARTHIVHAIGYVLSREPVQGKAALNLIFRDMLSPSFPNDKERVTRFLQGKYLGNPKPVLVRNLLAVLFKVATGSEPDFSGKESRAALAFAAVGECQPALFDEYAPEVVRKVSGKLDHPRLMHIPRVASADVRVWDWVPEPQRIQVTELVTNASEEQLKTFGVYDASNVPELSGIMANRFAMLDRKSKIALLSSEPLPRFKAEAIELFGLAGSFRMAESLMQSLILPYAPYFDAADIAAVLTSIVDNGQINYASGVPGMTRDLFDETLVFLPKTKSHWRKFVTAVGRGKKRSDQYAFPGIRKRLIEHGIMQR